MTLRRIWLDEKLEAAHDPRPGRPKAPVCPDHLEQVEVRVVLGRGIVANLEAAAGYPEGSEERCALMLEAAHLMIRREDWDPS